MIVKIEGPGVRGDFKLHMHTTLSGGTDTVVDLHNVDITKLDDDLYDSYDPEMGISSMTVVESLAEAVAYGYLLGTGRAMYGARP